MTDTTRCTATVWKGFHSYSCMRQGAVEREGKHYCRQHDPQAKAAKRASEAQAEQARDREAEAIDTEGKRLLEALGVGGRTYYHVGNTFRQSGVREAVVISFEDARRLIERLK